MSLNRELIRSYAQALYAAASAANEQHRARRELAPLLAFARQQPGVIRRIGFSLNSPRLDAQAKQSLLAALADAFGLGELCRNWLALLAQRGRFNLLAACIEDFVTVYRAGEGLMHAVVESAFPMSVAELEEIRSALDKATGKRFDIESRHAPSLLAGIRVSTATRRWDLSIRGALERLAQRLA